MLVGHLTDLHALAPGKLLGGVLDANKLARMAVDTMNDAALRPAFVVVTGDLTHSGKREEMEQARDILDCLHMPYFVLPGAHDDEAVFREVFAHRLPRGADEGDLCFAVDGHAVRLVVAQTTTGKGNPPAFGADRCAALDALLAEGPDQPTLLAIHHPPFQCRIPVAAYVQDPGMEWARGLERTVVAHDQVKLVVSGHVHRAILRAWAGTVASVGPSTCVQSAPSFEDFVAAAEAGRRNVSLIVEPPACQVHWWDGAAFVTYVLPTDRSYPRY